MKTDLGRDAFTVTYDPEKVDVEAIVARIRMIGYRPERASPETPEKRVAAKLEKIPEPVASALTTAREAGRLLLVDFYADWCGPCQVMETRVLTDAEVRKALEGFQTLKLDTDKYPEPSRGYRVVGLPTLLVLGPDGEELYRHEGPIEPAKLARELAAVSAGRKQPREDQRP